MASSVRMAPDTDRTLAAGYVRVSQERSAKHGYGLGAQETEVNRYIAYRGWQPAGLYREEGISGYQRDRLALTRLLADARAGAFQVAVFPSIDRAGRSVKDLIEIDQALRAAGAATVYLREGVDTSTPAGQLFRNIMASLAEFEGRVIYERLSKGKARKRAEGGYTGGWLPYGHQRDDIGQIVEVPDEIHTIRLMRRLRTRGWSLARIARELTARGIPAQKGGLWRVSTVQRLSSRVRWPDRILQDRLGGRNPGRD